METFSERKPFDFEGFPKWRQHLKETITNYNYKQDFKGGCFGFVWEADSVARCIRDGKVDNERACGLFSCCHSEGSDPSWRSLARKHLLHGNPRRDQTAKWPSLPQRDRERLGKGARMAQLQCTQPCKV